MSISKSSPSNVHFVVASIAAASVLGAPAAAHAGAGSDARAAIQRSLVAQGVVAGGGLTMGAPNNAQGGAGSTAGLLVSQAQGQLARDQARRQTLLDLQTSARAAAQASVSTVPNGLAGGGLVPAAGAAAGSAFWSGASLPAQKITNGAFTVTIQQNEPQANLTWDSFNIGRDTKLVFSQAQSDWVVFNQIVDAAGSPSRILGSVEAAGQVYVINPNGVIFEGSSQVNTRTLVASALPINDGLVARGLLNNPDTQFLFSGISVPAGAQTNAFVPPAPTNAGGRYGDVIVEAGAILSSPTNADKSGGRVALVGANVANHGTISTPDGQTILAAGLQVGLEASTDASLRGLLPSVGQVGDYAGSATNAGLIEAARGAVTVVGKDVAQNGSIRATTSVSRNGRVDLLAQYGAVGVGDYAALPDFFSTKTGVVTLGENSVTQVLPELESKEKAVGAKLALGSQVNALGLVVHLAEDASLLAPSATVSLEAGEWNLLQLGTGEAKAQFVHSAGQVYLDSGASVNVAGSAGVKASVADNIVTASLRGDELANSPLQRDGALRGQSIQVDMLQTGVYDGRSWVGTPLADVSGYINLVQRDIGQLTAAGGKVSINAGGSVVLAAGSDINVSGGYVDYQSAVVQTTKVIFQGNIIDISKATPDLLYEGVYDGVSAPIADTAKWGSAAADMQASYNRLFIQAPVAGYIQGGDAGSLVISAPAVALDGDLAGRSVSGPRQTTATARSGSLSLTFQGQYAEPRSNTGYFTDSRTPPTVRFETGAAQPAPVAFGLDSSGKPLPLSAARVASVSLSPGLVSASGFGRLTVDNREGDVIVAPGGGLSLPAGGELSLSGANVLVRDNLSAPAGKIGLVSTAVSLDSINQSSLSGASPVGGADRGLVEVAPSVRISAAGLVENAAIGADNDPALIRGGSVSITGFDVDLKNGSVIDVSGGVFASPGARYSYGDGGSIGIFSGQDTNIKNITGGSLALGAELLGYSGARGATLALQAPLIHVGAATSAAAGANVLGTDFFQKGGFSGYDIRGLGDTVDQDADSFVPAVRIAGGTEIRPAADSFVVRADDQAPEKLSFSVLRLDASQRVATSISFTAQGVRDPYNSGNPLLVRGDLLFEKGASINTDPAAKISLSGDSVSLDGSLVSRGGSITLRGASNSNLVFPNTSGGDPVATLRLGSDAVVDASGVLVSQPDVSGRGLRLGRVLSGGTVGLAGNIQAAAGSLIDVSGASAVLDLAPAYSGSSAGSADYLRTVATRVESSGGTLTLAGAQQLFAASTLRGDAGGASAEGGRLTVSSGIYVPVNGVPTTLRDTNLVVTQSLAAVPDLRRGGFAADSFNSSGFDSITLGGTVRFSGDVSLAADRDVRVGTNGVIYADGDVSLSAARVSLGTALQNPRVAGQDPDRAFYDANNNPLSVAPVHGAATLSVYATQLVDVGNLSLQGIGSATLSAPSGDIRGSGTFDIAGDLTLGAGQVYPPSATVFTVNAYDYTVGGAAHTGSISVESAGSRPGLPLSAGGTLNLHAAAIVQNGTLRAPFGSINLGWNGVGSAPIDAITGSAVSATSSVRLGAGGVTSVSGIDSVTGKAVVVPYGAYVNGTSWIDPQGNDITNFGPPEKQVVLSAGTVTTDASALVELNGGGELITSRFKTGVGGKIDILAASGTFAIIPGYDSGFAPFAAFNDSVNGQKLLGGDLGYVGTGLASGDRVYLDASPGLPAGCYTLLPARYAVVPGAFLITPKSGAPVASAAIQPDRAVYVSGYRFNSDGAAPSASPLHSLFEIASAEVVRKRATYETPVATAFFRDNAAGRGVSAPRLPGDAGRLVFTATQSMNLAGDVSARAANDGLGGEVDIDSPGTIRIGRPGGSAAPGELFLDVSGLDASRLGGASLLIGGRRSGSDEGTSIAVNAGRIIVDNAGSALTGAEIILAASQSVTLAADAEIRQTGTLGGVSSSLVVGDATIAGSGDGALMRVGGSADATLARHGVSPGSSATLALGSGAVVAGGPALSFDSTGATLIAADAGFGAQSLSLRSGRISLQLDGFGALPSDAGLVLGGEALETLQSSSKALSLLSYSSVDLYGVGTVGSASFDRLVIGAPLIRGFNQNGGSVAFAARDIEINGGIGGSAPSSGSNGVGSLSFSADTLTVGSGLVSVAQFSDLTLDASKRLVFSGSGGLSGSGSLSVHAPLVTADTAASQALSAAGFLRVAGAAAATSASPSALGASLRLSGGAGVAIDSAIELASGRLDVSAGSGDLSIGENASARIDVGGAARRIRGAEICTNAGSIDLAASAGDIRLGAQGTLDVAAATGDGRAGDISVSAASGRLETSGSVLGAASRAGDGGSFSADLGYLADGSLRSLDALLNQGGFDNARAYRVRSGDVTVAGLAHSASYQVSADNGSVSVAGKIDASGTTGGSVDLSAHRNLVLLSGSEIDASGDAFNSAGKGGSVRLVAGASRAGVADQTASLTLAEGSRIDLSVAASDPAKDASLGHTTGTLHLRAPRTALGEDLRVAALAGEIVGASSVVLEGFKVHDLTPVSGTTATLGSAARTTALADASLFGNAAAAIISRVALDIDPSILHVQPGVEIINRAGDLVLQGVWDLSTARYGAASSYVDREPGVLTLRAAGDILLPYSASGSASLSDGFGNGSAAATNTTTLWNAALLPQGGRSWTYQLAAGADLSAARTLDVLAADPVAPSRGSILIGDGAPEFSATLDTRQTAAGVPRYYQVVRTGTGDISLAARGDIEFRNNLATIYTAGTQAAALADFDTPDTGYNTAATDLGSRQYTGAAYPAQYALLGGDVSLFARNDIFRTFAGRADSSKQMPENWLYRRGAIDSDTGEFSAYNNVSSNGPRTQRNSTSWWVDYNNFFQSVGALGGGNVSVVAGSDVANIDAVAPTNARMPYGKPDASKLVELGGGDVTVRAGGDIDAGVYYVARGEGVLSAGGDITTNHTRTTVAGADAVSSALTASITWLPATLFLSDGAFDISAGGDVLLGAVADPFLLPGGINNSYFLKSYFGTLSADSSFVVSSLTGDVGLRSRNSGASAGSLLDWFDNVLRRNPALPTSTIAGRNQPWLRLYEKDVSSFATVSTLMPGDVSITAFTGDLNLAGEINIRPSTRGGLSLLAADSVNGLQVVGRDAEAGVDQWASAILNFSDSDPARLPGIESPLSVSVKGLANSSVVNRVVGTTVDMSGVNSLFAESGSYTGDIYGRLQTKQALHADKSVHSGSNEPVRILAGTGDISGLTLYSGKVAEVAAGRDISDVALYLQNLRTEDISVVSAGRDILLYNPGSELRVRAQASGNALLGNALFPGPGDGSPTAGDLQIGGPGSLQVAAGRDFSLGAALSSDAGGGLRSPGDGTAVGLSSIGNARNLSLPATGTRIVIGVGLGDGSKIDRAALERAFLDPSTAADRAARYLPALADRLGLSASAGASELWTAYAALPSERREELALAAFARILREAGRDHNDPDALGFGTYRDGFEAVSTLFPGEAWSGDLRLSSRELRTAAGGDITVYAPGGSINLGADIAKTQTPPGIITERGGSISLFTKGDVDIGTQRIFTLRGGDILIWSSTGNIAAGSSSTTLQSASPTRVLVDPQNGDVKTDLAGLATGGGIGVLAAIEGVKPGDVDLIAPVGTIDAGDAGIRSAGNLNISALKVVNAANISAGGATTGAPAVSAPAIGGLAASPATNAAASGAADQAAATAAAPAKALALPSLVTIEVLGYGGGTGTEGDDEKDEKNGGA